MKRLDLIIHNNKSKFISANRNFEIARYTKKLNNG